METEHISIEPPTWETSARIYIAALKHGTAEGKKIAEEELMRLAKLTDKLIKERNNG